MDYLKTDELILAIRDVCDQIAYGKAASEDDVWNNAYSRVSDEHVNMAIESACKYVASVVKSVHLINLHADAHPDIPENFLRLIDDSIIAGGIKARRMSYHERMGLSPARQPNGRYPAFQFEDCDLTIEGSDNKQAKCLTWPIYITKTYTGEINGDIVDGGVWEEGDEGVFITIEGQNINGPQKFSSTVASVLTGNKVRLTHASGENFVGKITYRDGQTKRLQSRLKEAVTMRAAELILIAMERPDMANVASANFANATAAIRIL